MLNGLVLAGGCALVALTTAMPQMANAQDVVVMRRTLAPPNPKTPVSTPTPTPSGTPTPTPTGTPTPTPTPTSAPGYSGYWVALNPIADAPSCNSQAPATREVQCRTGSTVLDPSKCDPMAKPSTTTTVQDYRSCTYKWGYGEWSTENNGGQTCGSYYLFRDRWCERSNGEKLNANEMDSPCISTGPIPDRQKLAYDYSKCTYRWNYSEYGEYSSTCSASATRTRTTNGCLRVEVPEVLTGADEKFCTEPKALSETGEVTSSCGYAWTETGRGAWTKACSADNSRSITFACKRSDGTTATADNLYKCGTLDPARQTEHAANYDGCTADWDIGVWGNYTPACAANTQRARTVSCLRQDGTIIYDETKCLAKTSPRPQNIETVPYAMCGYTPTYAGTAGACVPTTPGASTGTRTAQLSTCIRSDGTDVTAANAAGGYVNCAKQVTDQACTPVYTPTYSATLFNACIPTSSAYGSMPGTKTKLMTSCTSGDGANAPTTACSAGAATACSVSYTRTLGSPGACVQTSAGSANGTITTPIASCKRNDGTDTGTQVAIANCTAPTPTACTISFTCNALTNNQYYQFDSSIYDMGVALSWVASETTADRRVRARTTCNNAVSSNTSYTYKQYCGYYEDTPNKVSNVHIYFSNNKTSAPAPANQILSPWPGGAGTSSSMSACAPS